MKTQTRLADICIRDPFVLPYQDGYVITGTFLENGFGAYFTKDFEVCEGPYVLVDNQDDSLNLEVFWAPEIHEYNGKYYLFGTVERLGDKRFSMIYVSEDPLSNFTPVGRCTPEGWQCLDATLYIEDGEPYAVFCREWVEVLDGEIYAVKLSKDLSRMVDEPRLLFRALEAKWSREITGGKYKGYVTDGPFLFVEDGKLKMLWSSVGEQGYAMGVAVSDNGRLDGKWVQQETPFFEKDGGHGMLFEQNGQRCLTIHAPNIPKGAERMVIMKGVDLC